MKQKISHLFGLSTLFGVSLPMGKRLCTLVAGLALAGSAPPLSYTGLMAQEQPAGFISPACGYALPFHPSEYGFTRMSGTADCNEEYRLGERSAFKVKKVYREGSLERFTSDLLNAQIEQVVKDNPRRVTVRSIEKPRPLTIAGKDAMSASFRYHMTYEDGNTNTDMKMAVIENGDAFFLFTLSYDTLAPWDLASTVKERYRYWGMSRLLEEAGKRSEEFWKAFLGGIRIGE
jgi:hypothetical protein